MKKRSKRNERLADAVNPHSDRSDHLTIRTKRDRAIYDSGYIAGKDYAWRYHEEETASLRKQLGDIRKSFDDRKIELATKLISAVGQSISTNAQILSSLDEALTRIKNL